MKKILLIILGVIYFFCTGCANQMDQAYIEYLKQSVALLEKQEQKPQAQVELHENGTLKSFAVYQPQETPKLMPPPRKENPFLTALGIIAPIAGTIVGIHATGDALEGLINASSGNTSVSNYGSYNSSGGHMPIGGGGIDIKSITDSYNPSTVSKSLSYSSEYENNPNVTDINTHMEDNDPTSTWSLSNWKNMETDTSVDTDVDLTDIDWSKYDLEYKPIQGTITLDMPYFIEYQKSQ